MVSSNNLFNFFSIIAISGAISIMIGTGMRQEHNLNTAYQIKLIGYIVSAIGVLLLSAYNISIKALSSIGWGSILLSPFFSSYLTIGVLIYIVALTVKYKKKILQASSHASVTDEADPYNNLSTLLSTSIFIQIILFVVFSAYNSEYLGIKYLLIMSNIANVGLALIIKLYLQVYMTEG